MLALMAQPPALPNFYAPSASMSVAVLPSSPLTYGQPSIPTLLPPGPPASKRPKLSLNTANAAPIFGKNATSLRLETLSATSPTSRNTFRNTHEYQKKNAVVSTKSKLPMLSTTVQSIAEQILTTVRPEATDEPDTIISKPATVVPTSLDSKVESAPLEPPYKLSYNAKSILTNGPIPRIKRRRTSFSQTRPMFPDAKRVMFRAPLTEDVETTKYTMRHSDIESILSEISTAETTVSEQNHEGNVVSRNEQDNNTISEGQSLKQARRVGEKRDSSDDDSDTCPATPVAGRQKKHRQWRWTLAPVSPVSPVKHKLEDDMEGEDANGDA